MARHAPDQDTPITVATLRRLLTAAAIGCTLVAAASLALTAGLGTPTAAVFATIASAILFAGCAFDIAETRAARRAQPAQPAPPRVERLDALEAAIVTVTAAIDESQDEHREPVDAAKASIAALLDEPLVLAALADIAAADQRAAQPEPAGAAR